MGQEASVPRNNHGPDHGGEFPSNNNNSNNNHQAPPQGQGGRVSSGNNAVRINTDLHVNAAAAVVSPGVAAGGVGLAGGGVGSAARMAQQYHQQQQQQQPQSQHQLTAGSAAPPPPQHSQQYQQQQQHHPQQQGGSSSSSGSLMSRAGFTSMIQRMGGSSRGVQTGMAGGSGHGSSRRAGGKSPANNHNQNGPHYPQPPPSPQRGGAELSPSLNNNNGAYSPQRPEAYSIHHNDLSPESKARKHAMMMKNQQQQQLLQAQQKLEQQGQQIPHPPPLLSTQQSSGLSSGASYHTATGTGSANTTVNMMYTSEGQKTMGSSSKTLPTSNLTEHDTANNSNANNGGPASSLVQGMKNMAVSPGRNQQTSSQQQLPQPHKSPPSPRQQSLKKMQNNDEEDWQKAWEEDSESDDDDDEGDKSSTAAESGSPSKRMLPPVVPSLEIPPAGGKPPLGQERAPAAAAVGSALPYRPDMDSGHSSASVQVVPPPAMNSAMHHAFTPVTSQQPNQQQYYSQQQQQQYQSQQQFQHQQQQQQQIQQQQYQQQQQQSQPPQKPSFIGNQKAIATASSSIKTPIIQYTPTKEKAAPTSRNEADEDTRLTREANEALMGEDGQQHWDSYARGEEANEKPCVDMFDPALRVLGRGSFGRVVLVQKRQGQGIGSLYAMKILRKSHLVRRRQIERTKTERKVLSVLDHPFIMKMYYAFQTPEKLFLVLDYCPGGELFFHLSRYRRFQEPVARFYAAELLLAIGHLHKNGIIYRDLKPENVLLDAYGHVKLGDFGLAKDGIRHPTQGAKSTCGTPEYMAPEVLNQTGHGFCVDYWGLGMILYEMMTGLPPWYTTDRSKLFRRLRSAPLVFPNEVQFSPACRACIAGLLDREPRLRLGVMGLRSAVRHEFFYRRINFEALRARQIAAPIRPCEGWRQLQSRSSSMATNDSDIMGGPGGRHASLDSATMGGISAEALDVATANFDDSFRRMPIETEDYETQQQAAGHAPISENELNAGTFRGFTFDGDLPPTTENDNHHQQSQNRYQSGRPPPGRHNSGV